MSLDPTDLILIEALQQNAAQRLEDLGRLVNLAPSSVHDRLRRLEREGVIQRWTISVDAAALGLGVLAYVGVAGGRSCKVLLEDLVSFPEIEEVHSVAGELCMLLKVRVPDTNGLLAFIEKLRAVAGIEQTQTTIVLKTQIDRPVPPPAPAPPKRAKVRATNAK